ncbi:MAG: hypothetical protein BGP03_21075 [Pseudonocardia sp. 73-21]|nr:MAG: hypothetical protein BGP03_21075 [Pseudonocardia sp. 73-21]
MSIGPLPSSSTTRTDGSSASRVASSDRSRAIATSMALCWSGRSRRTVAMPSATSRVRVVKGAAESLADSGVGAAASVHRAVSVYCSSARIRPSVTVIRWAKPASSGVPPWRPVPV